MRIQKQPFLCEDGPMQGHILYLYDHTCEAHTLPIEIKGIKGRYIRGQTKARDIRDLKTHIYPTLQWEPL